MRSIDSVGGERVALTRLFSFVKIDTLFNCTSWAFDRSTDSNMRQLISFVVTLSLLLVTIAWLAASYAPALAASLPKIAFATPALQPVLWWLAVITLALFLLIQLNLFWTTMRWFRSSSRAPVMQALAAFEIRRSWELFWTLLPLLATLALFLWMLIGSPIT
jgi:hypothetical protein